MAETGQVQGLGDPFLDVVDAAETGGQAQVPGGAEPGVEGGDIREVADVGARREVDGSGVGVREAHDDPQRGGLA